jgi:Bacteriophage Lambda NinG protein
MTKKTKEYIKTNMPYFGKIKGKGRYSGIKAKAWSIVSDYTRLRDFIYYGRCVATGEKILDWRDGDAGHFYTMAGHGALIGFDVMNIHLQSKMSNKLSSASDGANFERELIERYGEEIIEYLNKVRNQTVKADDIFFLQKIKSIYGLFKELKEKYPHYNYPEYL